MKIIRAILLVVNILLALGLLLTTLAPVVAPSRSLLPSLLAFGYLPMLAANVLMVVLWLIMGKWQFLVSVAAIALRWSFVGLFVQVGGTTKTPDRSEHPHMVTVMSYNVHQFHGSDEKPSQPDSNALGFLSLVREYNPDMLCLLEFAAVKSMNLVDSLTVMGYNHYHGARSSSRGIPYGTVVFSRLPITYVNKIDGNKLLVELMLDDRRFRLCCIHMDSYQLDSTDIKEIDNMRHGELNPSSTTLAKVKKTILNHETEWQDKLKPIISESSVPMLLAGDFNDIPSSWLYAQVSKHLDDTYRDKGIGMCHTFNGGNDRLLPVKHGWLPKFRIDMVFHSKEFTTLSYKRPKTPLSDHYPVITSLELTQ